MTKPQISNMSGGWKGRPFEDEYDTYKVKVAEMLSADCGAEEVIEFLFHVESDLMGMSPIEIDEAIRSKLLKVVTAISASR